MRNIFIFYLFSFLILNCSSDKLNGEVTLFKKLIGKENTETLTFLINDFENNYLKIKYPNLKVSKAYDNFLKEVSEKGKFDISNYIVKGKYKFENSKLLLDIYEFPDSVWLDDELVINRKYIDHNEDGTKFTRYGKTWKSITVDHNKDSVILSELKKRELLYSGKYINALDSIKYTNNFLYEYVDFKKTMGSVFAGFLAKGMLKNDLDYSNFIIQSIIVIEFVY